MKNFINKEKIIGTLTTISVALFLVVILNLLTENSNYENYENEITKTKEEPQKEYGKNIKDTDGDGLFDWEEELIGTNLNKKDTDGDGTNDGDEVKQNRDPLVKESNNESDNKIIETTQNIKSVFQNFLDENKKETIENTSQENGDEEKSEEQLLKDYGNKIASLIENESPNQQSELFLFKILIENPTRESTLEKISGNAEQYALLSEKLKNIKEPLLKNRNISRHLEIADSYYELSENLNKIAGQKSQEEFMENSEKYNESVLQVGESVISTALFFDLNNIKFSSTEPGYLFTQIR